MTVVAAIFDQPVQYAGLDSGTRTHKPTSANAEHSNVQYAKANIDSNDVVKTGDERVDITTLRLMIILARVINSLGPLDGTGLSPQNYGTIIHQNFANAVRAAGIEGAVLPPSAAGYTAYDVPGFGPGRGLGRLLVDNGTSAIYYANNHYYSFYPIQLNPAGE